ELVTQRVPCWTPGDRDVFGDSPGGLDRSGAADHGAQWWTRPARCDHICAALRWLRSLQPGEQLCPREPRLVGHLTFRELNPVEPGGVQPESGGGDDGEQRLGGAVRRTTTLAEGLADWVAKAQQGHQFHGVQVVVGRCGEADRELHHPLEAEVADRLLL